MNELCEQFSYVYGVGTRGNLYKDTIIMLMPYNYELEDIWKVVLDIELPL